MVHYRLNEREVNPNNFINFIVPLPARDEDYARELLRALAAQVKPVMKAHGYTVNSFEEARRDTEHYKHNTVFLGRNWNAGETIEIVLRRAGGSFWPTNSLLDTLCHELAHITAYMQHMNHSRNFHMLWAQLRREVEELQANGYFGDGMWSSGMRLGDDERVGPSELAEGDAPEYICGGAHKESRKRALGRRRNTMRRKAGPSNFTGPQTEKKGKPGRRIRGDDLFEGDGKALNDDRSGSAKTVGIGFRKQAGSKSAREARAAAAEARLARLTAGTPKPPDIDKDENASDEDDEDESEPCKETDDDRRQMLLESMHDVDDEDDALELLRTANGHRGLVTCGSDEPPRKKAKAEARLGPVASSSAPSASTSAQRSETSGSQRTLSSFTSVPAKRKQGTMLEDEIRTRKREAIGLDQARTLGGRPAATRPASAQPRPPHGAATPAAQEWSCPICTLVNPPLAPICAACETLR
ncbi:WLM-domain-containing protein [Exidia glandulosa HHB12029]|uniref:WLM-domain-containing protein n=1 Tax=Exidia glandulosa HHB12029 TaxID=1314781 RepID=A0A165L6T4_EXIGL|nr:WLM-domain-containing protein [Exidia glandulosa HHB12029]